MDRLINFLPLDDCKIAATSIVSNPTPPSLSLPPTLIPIAPDIPRPAWKDTKEKIQRKMEESRLSTKERIAEWMSEGRVLGHQPRSNVNAPVARMSMPDMKEMNMKDNNDDDNSNNGSGSGDNGVDRSVDSGR
jgi:hypothetical protein